MTKAYSVRLDNNILSVIEGFQGSTLSDKIRRIVSWVGTYPLYHESINSHIVSSSMTEDS